MSKNVIFFILVTLALFVKSQYYSEICWLSVHICSENDGDGDSYYAAIEINGVLEIKSNSVSPSSPISSGGWTITCSNCCYTYGPSSTTPSILLTVYNDDFLYHQLLYSVAPSGNAGTFYLEQGHYSDCTERIEYTVTDLNPTPSPTWSPSSRPPTSTPTPYQYWTTTTSYNEATTVSSGNTAGTVVGIIVLCCVIGFVVFCCRQRQRRRRYPYQNQKYNQGLLAPAQQKPAVIVTNPATAAVTTTTIVTQPQQIIMNPAQSQYVAVQPQPVQNVIYSPPVQPQPTAPQQVIYTQPAQQPMVQLQPIQQPQAAGQQPTYNASQQVEPSAPRLESLAETSAPRYSMVEGNGTGNGAKQYQ